MFPLNKVIHTLLIFIVIFLGLGNLNAQSLPLIGASSLANSNNWNDLSTVQKKILITLENDWSTLSVEQRIKWIQLANRYDDLTESEKERLSSRMADWAKLSINKRRFARQNYLKSLSISNERKLEAWEAYQQLSPEEKQKLLEKASEKSKQKKPSLVNSPSLKSN